MQQIFINNQQARLQTICVMEPQKDSRLKPIRRNIQLEPGANPVDKHLWELALKVKAVAALVSDGKLLELGPTADGSISGLKEEEAMAIVKETFSLRLLRSWFVSEKRTKVQAAIKKRLDESEAETKEESKS